MKNLAVIVLAALLTAASFQHGQSEEAEPVLIEDDICVYTIYVGTGTEWRSWADGAAAVGIKLCDSSGDCFSVSDLVAWGGQMWSGHEYFQWGAVDVFSGRAHCLAAPPCSLEIAFSGAGDAKWLCEFVQVTTTGPALPCYQRMFMVQQWLSLDEDPRKWMAFRDECGSNETSRVYL